MNIDICLGLVSLLTPWEFEVYSDLCAMGGHGSEKQRLPRRPGEEPWSLVAGFALVISVGEDENLWEEV